MVGGEQEERGETDRAAEDEGGWWGRSRARARQSAGRRLEGVRVSAGCNDRLSVLK